MAVSYALTTPASLDAARPLCQSWWEIYGFDASVPAYRRLPDARRGRLRTLVAHA